MLRNSILAFLISCSSGFLLAQDAKEIIQKAEEKIRGVKTAQSEMQIKIVRPIWTREMSMKTWSKGEKFSLILITSPAKEKGTTFLKRGKEVWNWIPSVERSIKLPPSMMMQNWMGTDLTNDDLVRESSQINDYDHKLLGEETINGRACYKIEMIPKPDAAVVWGKVILYIDKTDYIQLKSEMYDEDEDLINVMTSSEIKVMDGKKIATRNELVPVGKDGQKTIMIIKSMKFDDPIEDSFFTQQNMKRVR